MILRIGLYFGLILTLLPYTSSAQSRKVENITKVGAQNVGVLKSGSEVKGYYLFHRLSKAQKGMRQYRLTIFDTELQVSGTSEFSESKNMALVEGVSSGSTILLKFVDLVKYHSVLMAFDHQGQLLKKISNVPEKKDKTFPMNSIYGSKYQSIPQKQLHSTADGGFLHYMPWSKGAYHVDYVSPSGQVSWSYINNEERSAYQYLAVAGQLVLSTLSLTAEKKKQAPDLYLQALDLKSGKERFRLHIDNQYISQPLTAFYDPKSEAVDILGLYYSPQKEVNYSHSLGLFRYRVNLSGEVMNQEYVAWAADIAQRLGMNKKGKTADGYLYYHEILPHPDGSFLVVAEKFRRTADAAGIAMSLLSNNASTTKMVAEDMMVLQFNPDLSLETSHTIEKTPRNFDLHGNYAIATSHSNIHMLAQRMKLQGGFDYEFSQALNGNTLSIHFRSKEKEKGPDVQYLGSVIYQSGEINERRLPLEWRTLRVFPAPDNRLAIFRIDYKADVLHIDLKKVNSEPVVDN